MSDAKVTNFELEVDKHGGGRVVVDGHVMERVVKVEIEAGFGMMPTVVLHLLAPSLRVRGSALVGVALPTIEDGGYEVLSNEAVSA